MILTFRTAVCLMYLQDCDIGHKLQYPFITILASEKTKTLITMKKILTWAVILGATSLMFTSCKDDKNDDPTTPVATENPQMTLDIGMIFGQQTLSLNNQTYTNEAGEQFTVSTFKFYLTNIKLVDMNNNDISLPDSYYLVDLADATSNLINVKNIPEGTYKGMRFMIGVDTSLYSQGSQPGDLDPANGMFWTWNTGYINLKLEGNSPVITGNGAFQFHIGGFVDPNNTLREITMDFGTFTLNAQKNKNPEVHLVVDLEEFFKNPMMVSIASMAPSYSIAMPGPMANAIATNYQDMWQFDHIHDD